MTIINLRNTEQTRNSQSPDSKDDQHQKSNQEEELIIKTEKNIGGLTRYVKVPNSIRIKQSPFRYSTAYIHPGTDPIEWASKFSERSELVSNLGE